VLDTLEGLYVQNVTITDCIRVRDQDVKLARCCFNGYIVFHFWMWEIDVRVPIKPLSCDSLITLSKISALVSAPIHPWFLLREDPRMEHLHNQFVHISGTQCWCSLGLL
jgi:hypothetical protein